VNIPHQFQEISILIAQDRPVSPLEKMSHLTISLVEITGMPKQKGLHEPAQRNPAHFEKQVNVSLHEDVCIKLNVVSGFAFGEIE
jgi:hypothetical protein